MRLFSGDGAGGADRALPAQCKDVRRAWSVVLRQRAAFDCTGKGTAGLDYKGSRGDVGGRADSCRARRTWCRTS